MRLRHPPELGVYQVGLLLDTAVPMDELAVIKPVWNAARRAFPRPVGCPPWQASLHFGVEVGVEIKKKAGGRKIIYSSRFVRVILAQGPC